jgi:hypothetical protein
MAAPGGRQEDDVAMRLRLVTPALAVLLALTVLLPARAAAQSPDSAVGHVPGAHLHTLLQRTILKVDVLNVDVCFDEATAQGFVALAARGRLRGAAADSIAQLALAGRFAVGRVEFLRDIPLRDFLEGVGEDLNNAGKAGLLADSVERALIRGLPVWYAPLQQRGIRKGDVLLYELRAASVRTTLTSREGRVLLDRSETGRARRNSPLAAWLAPGSSFREGLLRSLERSAARGGARGAVDPPCRRAG